MHSNRHLNLWRVTMDCAQCSVGTGSLRVHCVTCYAVTCYAVWRATLCDVLRWTVWRVTPCCAQCRSRVTTRRSSSTTSSTRACTTSWRDRWRTSQRPSPSPSVSRSSKSLTWYESCDVTRPWCTRDGGGDLWLWWWLFTNLTQRLYIIIMLLLS